LSAKFDQFNLSLSNLQADNIESLADAFTDVSTVVDLARQRFVADLAPAIEIVIERLFLAEARAGEFGDTVASAADRTVRGFAFVLDAIEGVRRTAQVLGRSMAVAFAAMELGALQLANTIVNGPGMAMDWLIRQASRISGIEIEFQFGAAFPQVQAMMDRAAGIVREGVADIHEVLMAPLPGQTMLEEYAERMGREVSGAVRGTAEAMGELASASAATESSVGRMIRALEEQFDTLGQTGSQVQLYRLQIEGATESQMKHAEALLSVIAAHESHQELLRAAERVMQDNKSAAELYVDELMRLKEMVDANVLSLEEYEKAVERISASMFPVEEAEKSFSLLDEFAKQAARNMQTYFADFLFDPFKDGLSGMLRGFADTMRRMIVEAAAAQILQQMFAGFGSSANPFLSSLAGAFGGSRDSGGRGVPGQAYLIGTGAQPEMFIPDTAGTFVPATAMGGATNYFQTIVQAPEGRITRESESRARAMQLAQSSEWQRRNG